MDKRALQLGSRFCLPPNSLGYCGEGSAAEKFKSCIIGGNCEVVEQEFSKFIVFYPYLKTISQITDLPKYSYEVMEGYCIGNELLEKAKNEHYDLLLENFKAQGVPDWLINELKSTPPEKFIPHHLFQVLHVGVGRASGSVPFNLESINNCMVRWGKVLEMEDGRAHVRLNSLREKGVSYELAFLDEKHRFDSRFFSSLDVGDTVAVHWKQVVKKLTADEIEKISYWTSKVLGAASR